MKSSATHYGTCQNCEREQKLPDGKLSKHGYQVAGFGFFNGICWAAGELPYEQSCECIKSKIIPILQGHIKNLTIFRKKLLSTATEEKGYWEISGKYFTTWAKVNLVLSENGSQMMILPAGHRPEHTQYLSCYRCYFDEGKTLLETATNMNRYYATIILKEIKYTKKQLAHQEQRVINWKIRPLKPVEVAI